MARFLVGEADLFRNIPPLGELPFKWSDSLCFLQLQLLWE